MKRHRTEHVLLSADVCSHVCSFLGLRELSLATSVSRQWQTVRKRPWAIHMFQRREKKQWCMDREWLFSSPTADEMIEHFEPWAPKIEERLLHCDQQFFSWHMVWRYRLPANRALHKVLAASLINPFDGLGDPSSDDLNEVLWDQAAECCSQINKRLPHLVAQVDRLSLVDFQFLWGSYELSEVTAEQSVANRKRRLAFLDTKPFPWESVSWKSNY